MFHMTITTMFRESCDQILTVEIHHSEFSEDLFYFIIDKERLII